MDEKTKPEQETKFVAIKEAIMRGAEHIATARSTTFAKRIANALNKYIPDKRGQ